MNKLLTQELRNISHQKFFVACMLLLILACSQSSYARGDVVIEDVDGNKVTGSAYTLGLTARKDSSIVKTCNSREVLVLPGQIVKYPNMRAINFASMESFTIARGKGAFLATYKMRGVAGRFTGSFSGDINQCFTADYTPLIAIRPRGTNTYSYFELNKIKWPIKAGRGYKLLKF